MSWFLDGLGTFLIGLLFGAGGDRILIKMQHAAAPMASRNVEIQRL